MQVSYFKSIIVLMAVCLFGRSEATTCPTTVTSQLTCLAYCVGHGGLFGVFNSDKSCTCSGGTDVKCTLTCPTTVTSTPTCKTYCTGLDPAGTDGVLANTTCQCAGNNITASCITSTAVTCTVAVFNELTCRAYCATLIPAGKDATYSTSDKSCQCLDGNTTICTASPAATTCPTTVTDQATCQTYCAGLDTATTGTYTTADNLCKCSGGSSDSECSASSTSTPANSGSLASLSIATAVLVAFVAMK
eukprot:GHVL01042227.1.p1 GENE.GHVL01042227.1~~GHVL01042227.1.p1  ORF type:complete len:247 (-),score=10.96 GHVL01042227.1:358-1098(-)